MCCFAKPVLGVANTRIFARRTSSGSQYLAYQMEYESKVPNAMILPLPVRQNEGQSADEEAVRFIDLSDYESFFDDLESGFPYREPRLQIGCAARLAATDSALAVQQVGSFIASFVPGIDDFSRLDPQFVIPQETWANLPHYADYGFAVFQLKELAAKSHPMAMEFPSQIPDVYFPTVHIHDGDVHAEEEFDHSLYLQHAGFDSKVSHYVNYNVPDRNTRFVRSQEPAEAFFDVAKSAGLIQPDLLVHKTELQGTLPNRDMLYAIKGDPSRPRANWRKLANYWPVMLGLGGLAWFFERRMRIKRRRLLAGHEVDRTDKPPRSEDG